ncbi:MAG: hypothetical protein AB1589_10255 [Cyanobacteriota bacterium]
MDCPNENRTYLQQANKVYCNWKNIKKPLEEQSINTIQSICVHLWLKIEN